MEILIIEHLSTLTPSVWQKFSISISDACFCCCCCFATDRSTSLWPYRVLGQTAETGLISGAASSLSVLTAAICDCFQDEDFNRNFKILASPVSNKNKSPPINLILFFLSAFSKGERELEPVPSVVWIYLSTSHQLIAGLHVGAFEDSVPCSKTLQQHPEGVLAPLLPPAHLPTVVRNQEPFISQPRPTD